MTFVFGTTLTLDVFSLVNAFVLNTVISLQKHNGKINNKRSDYLFNDLNPSVDILKGLKRLFVHKKCVKVFNPIAPNYIIKDLHFNDI